MRNGFFGAALLLLVAGCGSSDDNHGAATGDGSGATCPSGSMLTYDNFGKAFMTSFCLRCHSTSVTGAARQGAPDDHNFDDLASIKAMKDHIDEEAAAGPTVVNSSMPPDAPGPTEAQRRDLGAWLACGAP